MNNTAAAAAEYKGEKDITLDFFKDHSPLFFYPKFVSYLLIARRSTYRLNPSILVTIVIINSIR